MRAPAKYQPAPGVDYTKVLTGSPQLRMTATTGLAVILFGFFFVSQGISSLVCWIGWLGRGRPGTFTSFSSMAMSFGVPEGVLGANLGLASFVVIAMLAMRLIHRYDTHWLASVQPGMRWRYLVIVAVVAAIVFNAVYWATDGRVNFHWAPLTHVWVYIVIIIVTGPLQAAGEEYFFRGYLQQLVGTMARQRWLVVLVSGVLFTAAHGTQNLPLLADRFAFGAIMGALVVLTGGLEAAIAVHAVNNIFAFGYPALSGTLADARTMSEVSWATAGTNVLAYAVIALLAYAIGRAMKVATTTPA